MNMRPDYYQILDVEPTVPQAELKRAYYRQARRFHPDCNDGDPVAEERFKLVAEAYRVLGNEDSRRDYDEQLERHRRYADAPELAAMHRRVRVSARHGRARREGDERHSAARRRGTSLLRKVTRPVGMWTMVVFYAMAAFMIVPSVLRGCGVLSNNSYRRTMIQQEGEKPELSPEQKLAALAESNARLLAAAEAGEQRAQLRLAMALYHGLGLPLDREAARKWFAAAAEQGNEIAAKCLRTLNFDPPPPKEEKPEEESAPAENAAH